MSHFERTPFDSKSSYSYTQYQQEYLRLGPVAFDANFSEHTGIYEKIFREASSEVVEDNVKKINITLFGDIGNRTSAQVFADYDTLRTVYGIMIDRSSILGWMTDRAAVVDCLGAIITQAIHPLD